MKEDKKIMNEKITEIGETALDCLQGKKFNNVIIGYFVKEKNKITTQSMEFFYQSTEDILMWMNELNQNNQFSEEKKKFLKLQDLLHDLYNYCKECGDKWKYITFKINSNGHFTIDFKYDAIEIDMWKRQNGII